jgi:pyruvate dehydrogenase E1 component alpha subunit
MRSERDPIAGLKRYILDWNVTDEASLKVRRRTDMCDCVSALTSQAIDKAAKEEVDEAVEEAKKSPKPDLKEFWTDIYVSKAACQACPCTERSQYKGTEPPYMRGREKEEVHYYQNQA